MDEIIINFIRINLGNEKWKLIYKIIIRKLIRKLENWNWKKEWGNKKS